MCFTGDIGGMAGLLLGGSILSVVEIVDLLLYNAVVKMSMVRRFRRPRMPRPRQLQVTPV